MRVLLAFIFYSFFWSNYSFADLKIGQKGKIEFDTFYTFDLSSFYSKEYLERPLKGKGH